MKVMAMELRELRYFVAVVDSGSMGRAADVLGLSQPALSKSIRQLEERLAVSLLDRGAKGVKPTVFGQSLWLHAKAIIAEVERAEHEIADLSQTGSGVLSIGILPSLAGDMLSEAVLRLSHRHERLRVQVIERPATELIDALRRSEFDLVLGVVDPDSLPSNLTASVLYSDRPALVVRSDHLLASKRPVTWEEINRFPWVLSPPSSRRRRELDRLLTQRDTRLPDRIIECHSTSFLKAIVLQSDYVGVLPGDNPNTEEAEGTLVRLAVAELPPARQIGFLYRSDFPLPQAAKTLMREVRRSCESRQPLGTRSRGRRTQPSRS